MMNEVTENLPVLLLGSPSSHLLTGLSGPGVGSTIGWLSHPRVDPLHEPSVRLAWSHHPDGVQLLGLT